MSVGVFFGEFDIRDWDCRVCWAVGGGSASLGFRVFPFGTGGFHSKFAVLYLKIAGGCLFEIAGMPGFLCAVFLFGPAW